jgi:phospholipid-binding lipoprotein MlaA
MFFFILTLYSFNCSLFAEEVAALGSESATGESSNATDTNASDEDEFEDDIDIALETTFIKDSMPSYNRAIFTFNDKAYYYVMRPVSNGYKFVVPEKARVGVRNFFTNVRMPIRFFNCLFQGKFKGAGTEFARLIINSTVGVAGFSDAAKKHFNLDIQDEDFGQTLGNYNCGAGTFIQLPLLGPSNVRDTIGLVADIALDPITLLGIFVSPYAGAGTRAYVTLNDISIDKGDTYEALVEDAIDPYIAIQDAYTQNRIKKINE